jgi:hypothetical protein
LFYYRAYELNIASDLEFPGLVAVEPELGAYDHDISISTVDVLPDLPNATIRESWWQVSPTAFRMEVDAVAVYQVENGRRILVQALPDADPADVRIFLMGSAMGALLYQRGLFPLHGSAVETPWGAMVFVGPSGIGKSTLAAHFHRAGYRLIADDVCAISRAADGSLLVLPAFPHLRLKTDAVGRLYGEAVTSPPSHFDVDKFVLSLGEGHASTPVPLGAVHVLKDADNEDNADTENPILTPLGGFESIQALADNLYRPNFLQGMQTRGDVLRLAGEIAQSTEIVQLSRPRDAAKLDGLVLWLEQEWTKGRSRQGIPAQRR